MKTKTKNWRCPFIVMGIVFILTNSCEKPSIYEGLWSGNVEFAVSEDGVITSFSDAFDIAGYVTVYCNEITNAKITGESFSFTLDNSGVKTQVSGTFTSDHQVSGKYGPFVFDISIPGMTITGTMSGYTWTASKK